MKKRILVILTAVLSCALTLSGCGKKTDTAEASNDNVTSNVAETSDLKTLTIATASETDRLSPLYMGLFTPGLAKRWEFRYNLAHHGCCKLKFFTGEYQLS